MKKRLIFLLITLSFLLNNKIDLTAEFKKPVSKGKVKVIGRQIYVDDKPFFIKGVGYQPVPIGIDVGYPVYDKSDIYQRDLKLLRSIGCNTLRTWGAANNKGFLDACYNNGKDSIYVITGPYLDPKLNFAQKSDQDKVIAEWKKFINEFKDHPAILMWQLGNEYNYWHKHNIRDYYKFLNKLAKIAYELEGENYHPFTTANGDVRNPTGPVGDKRFFTDDKTMDYLDVWGANVYIGKSFGNMFEEYSLRSEKPLWISEYGCDALDDRTKNEYQDVHAGFGIGLWNEMEYNSDICSGGTIMAYSDEWWKGGNIAEHDKNGWKSDSQPDGVSNEEWYGVVAVAKQPGRADRVIPRKLYYEFGKAWKRDVVFKDISKRKYKLKKEDVIAGVKKDMRVSSIIPGDPVSPADIQFTKVSSFMDANKGELAVDRDESTRWESSHKTDPSWIVIGLKSPKKITGISINWEKASAKKYRIEVSNNNMNWMRVASVTDGKEEEQREIYFQPVTGRYVRIFCEQRTTDYGYSIWEIKLNPGNISSDTEKTQPVKKIKKPEVVKKVSLPAKTLPVKKTKETKKITKKTSSAQKASPVMKFHKPEGISGKVYSWLKFVQRDDNGFLESKKGSDFVSLYDNSLAAIVFCIHGDFANAEKIFDSLSSRMEIELKKSPGGFSQIRHGNGTPLGGKPHRWLGDNAWLLIALNNYHYLAGNNKYETLAMELEKWIRSLQDKKDGGLYSGYDVNGKLLAGKTTEGIIDAFDAVKGYDDFHKGIVKYLKNGFWDYKKGIFLAWREHPIYKNGLDVHSWGYCAFKDMPYSMLQQATLYFTTKEASANGKTIKGFCFDTDHDTIWLEGVGEMVVAYNTAGDFRKAEYFIRELEKMVVPDKMNPEVEGVPYCTNQGTHYAGGDLWEGVDTNPSISGSTWYLMGKLRYDPMAIGRKKDIPEKDMFWKNRNELPGGIRKDIQTMKVVPGDPVEPGDIQFVKVSSFQDEHKGEAVIDQDDFTRWESKHRTDPSWVVIGLKKPKKISGVFIDWEPASAKNYRIEVSNNNMNWVQVARVTDGKEGEKREIYFSPRDARYVRIFCEQRTTDYGYSIWEIKLNPGSG
ncbi:MAG: discoidin domain-containing protein [Elusimicrobia bacterium]|nr:discoidin domain-containing protein [Elusimicrobiota bacterium]